MRKRGEGGEREREIKTETQHAAAHLLYATSVGRAQTATSSEVLLMLTCTQIFTSSSPVARFLIDPTTPAATAIAIWVLKAKGEHAVITQEQ